MEKRTIYRIEDPETGDGFWRSSTNGFYNGLKLLNHSRYEAISDRHNDATKFPSHSQDTELNSKINNFAIQFYHFAFLSMDQIKEALTLEEIKELIDKFGFRVYAITCTDYHTSKFQVVFKKESIVEKIDISELFT